MKLNHTLAEITGNWEWLGEWIYFISIFGEPHATEPWGWQLDGHHLNISYFVLGDQVVLSPGFWGAEPTHADRGVHQGLRMFEEEERSGLELINALDPGQRGKAILKVSKTGNEVLTEAWRDNVVLDYAGLNAKDMSTAQRQQLLDLVALYVDNMAEGHARVKMNDVRKHLDRTWFAWMGGTGANEVFYYRIHSPVVLIEFDSLAAAENAYNSAGYKEALSKLTPGAVVRDMRFVEGV